MDVKISAIVCTHNRASYLRNALSSLVNQSIPVEKYEVIVVDNGSQDDTSQVVAEFAQRSSIRYIYEPELGLSRARNTGWQNAQGEYIAYLDDDAIADQGWLTKIVEVFETFKPRPGCIGGKVNPIWESPQPRWLSDSMMSWLAILDYSDTPVILDDPRHLVGANIAYPRHLLETMSGFNISLGRKGNNLLSNEESLLHNRLVKMGYACIYHPEIIVGHHIQISRLNQAWFKRRLYWQGISNAILLIAQKSPTSSRRLLWALSAILKVFSPRRLFNLLIPTNDPQCFERKCSAFGQVGYLAGLLGMAK